MTSQNPSRVSLFFRLRPPIFFSPPVLLPSLSIINLGHLDIIIVIFISVVNINTIQLIIAVNRVGHEVVNSSGVDVLRNSHRALVTSRERLDVLLREVLVLILILVVAVHGAAVQGCLALGQQLGLGLGALRGAGPAAAVGEEVEEGGVALAGLVDQFDQGLVLGQFAGGGVAGLAGLADEHTVELLGGVLLLGSPEVVGGVGEAPGQVLAGLPVDADGVRDETGGAVLAVAVEEGLFQNRVGEPLVLGEVEADGNGAGLAKVLQAQLGGGGRGRDLGAQDLDALEGVGEDLEVVAGDGGLELGSGVVKDDGPEAGDLADGVLAGGEDVLGHEILLGGDLGVDIAQAGLDEVQLLDGGGVDDELVGRVHF